MAKEAGFDSSLGEITIIHMNRHINVDYQVKKLIELVQANSVPDGWQLMPIEPNIKMIESMMMAGGCTYPHQLYRAAIKNAPKQALEKIGEV